MSGYARTVRRYALAVAMVAMAFGLKRLLEPITGTGAPFVLFFGSIVATCVWAGPGPGIFATLLSLPLGAYVFVMRAGYTQWQAITQAALFAFDGLIVVYLSSVMTRARRAAEASEARHRDLIDLAPEAFFLSDLDGRNVDVNQAACLMLGYEREELLRKTIADRLPPEDLPRLAAEKADLLVPGRVAKGEWRLRRKDGTFVPVEISANILPDGRWQAFGRDISERKRIEDERQVFVSLLDNSSDFIGIADSSGRPIYLNRGGRRMVGLSPDFPIEQVRIEDCYPRELRSFATDVILKTMLAEGRWSGETFLRHWQTDAKIPVSDEHFLIREAGGERTLGMGTIIRDISEARRVAREREELLARERTALAEAESANQRLRQSEELFRLTIDEAPIGMALVSLDGRFLRVNRALCDIVGYQGAELTLLTFPEITHPDDVDKDLALAAQLRRGDIPRYQLEKRYVRKDRTFVDVLLSGSVLRDADGAPIHYIAQVEDITERKRAEQALRLSEARFSGIITVSADAIISIDEEQKIVLFNDGAQRIFGYERADVVGSPLEVLIPEGLRAVHRQHVAGFAAGDATSRRMGERLATIVGRRRDGREFPAEAAISKLQVDGNPILTVALRDVTDRKRAEDEQRFLAEAGAVLASSLDYEQTLKNLGQLVVGDLADWCIVDVVEGDERARRLKVVSARPDQAPLAEQLEQLRLDRRRPHLAGLVLESRRPFVIDRVTPQRLEALSQSEEHLGILRAIDPRSIMGLPLLIRGQLMGVLVLISTKPARAYGNEDLHLGEALAERAALAIENGRLYQTAVRATQLRDEVLGVVAHDLRNPVAAISMQATALQRAQPEPEAPTYRAADRIVRAANRMTRLIGDLLDVTQIEAGQLQVTRERLSPREFFGECIEQQRPLAAGASLELRLELPDDLPDICGDPHRLNQVVENLIGNAIKFTPAQGRITVGASSRDGEVMCWVADTGCGISEEGLPHVFDRFWQARKGARQGAGLGLPITRAIIEAHGGRIWVESNLGRGTVFFFTLRSAPSAEAQPPETIH